MCTQLFVCEIVDFELSAGSEKQQVRHFYSLFNQRLAI